MRYKINNIKPNLILKTELDYNNECFYLNPKLKEFIEFLNNELNWDNQSIKKFIEIEGIFYINNDIEILEILEIFKIYKPNKNILTYLYNNQFHSENILKKINQEVVNFIFCENNIKTRIELLNEVYNMNSNIDNNIITFQFYQIVNILSINKDKNSEEFLRIFKENNDDIFLIIFLIKKLYEIESINIRESQILSLLLLINKSNSKGKISQIETGQGKTIIISMLASFLAIKYNCKVFIITSNIELAKRDAQINKNFYENCGLDIFPNEENDPRYISKEIYKKKRIFYGIANIFCGLIIRQKLETNCFEKNIYDSLIIDEVDNLTIDNFSTFTFLSTPINGFELLNPFYILIYCVSHCLRNTKIHCQYYKKYCIRFSNRI